MNKISITSRYTGKAKFILPSRPYPIRKICSKESEVFKVEIESRVAIIGIIVEEESSVEALNQILHEYSSFIIGRMGIPYPKKGINIISIAVDAPQDTISALSGKLGKLKGISSKAAYSKV